MTAATLLLALLPLQRADGEPVRTAPLPPGPGNPRNSGCDVLALREGLLLLVYARYSGRDPQGAVPELAARFSGDGGRTWTPKDVPVVRPEGGAAVWAPSLLRMADGSVGLFHLRQVSREDCRLVLRRSDDEARTWGAGAFVTSEPGAYAVAADRAVRLRGGRLLVPAVRHAVPGVPWDERGTAVFFVSDDDGASWRRTAAELRGPGAGGLREPLVVELKDGRLLLLAASDSGVLYRARSADGAETWSEPAAAGVPSAGRGLAAGRLPGTGDLLVVRALAPPAEGQAGPALAATLSRDEGETWSKDKALEEDPAASVGEVTLEFLDGRVFVAYGAGEVRSGDLTQTRVVLFDVAWLYR